MEWRRPVVVRALLATLTATAGLLLATLPAPPPAYAEEPVPLVRITLDVDEAGPAQPGRGDHPDRHGHQHHQRAAVPRPGLLLAQPGADHRPGGLRSGAGLRGQRPARARASPSSTRTCTPRTTPTWSPARPVPFTLTAPVENLELSPTDGIYLMGVHVLQNNSFYAIGRARLFVPMVSAKPAETLKMTSSGDPQLPPLAGPARRAGRRPPGPRGGTEGPAEQAARRGRRRRRSASPSTRR